MTASVTAQIRQRVEKVETTPSIPAVLYPLLKLLNALDEAPLDEVVKLVSYDNTIAAQCLRVASSPLFGLGRTPDSIKSAIIALGLRRVETILLTCCLGQAFPAKNLALDPTVFWAHSLGCAMVCRKFSEKLSDADENKAYMAGLLHDIGFLVNCMVYPAEFGTAVDYAVKNQTSFHDSELATMGFTHCETGRALAEKWNMSETLVDVIAHHHEIEQSEADPPLVALVHLSDLLCRMRGLGYGYYEIQKIDLVGDPAWSVLLKQHRDLADVDLVRFTFELDESVAEVKELVSRIFGMGMGSGRN